MAEFAEKVNIKHPVDPNHIDIQKDPFHPAAYIITLPLDSEPSYAWHTLFMQELWSSLDFWDRKVVITGEALRLVTTADHVADKLHWLEGVVSGANKRVDEYNKRLRAESARKSTLVDEETIRKDISMWQVRRIRV